MAKKVDVRRGAYAPAYPPEDPEDTEEVDWDEYYRVQHKEHKRRRKEENEANLQRIASESESLNRKAISSVFIPANKIRQNVIYHQALNIGKRLTAITPADLGADDDIPYDRPPFEEPLNLGCCNKIYFIDEKYKDNAVRAQFMSKTMFLMCIYILPAIVWTVVLLQIRQVHLSLSEGYWFYFIISWIIYLMIRIVSWKIRHWKIGIILLIFRSLNFAHVIGSLTLVTERVVFLTAFDADYKHRGGGNFSEPADTSKGSTSTREYLERYTYTLPYLWAVAFCLLFCTWLTTAVILHCYKTKINPNGGWIYGISPIFIAPTLLAGIYFLGVIEAGKGPRLWDITQVIVGPVAAQIESVWIPIRWQKIFDGQSIIIIEDRDYVYAALFLAF